MEIKSCEVIQQRLVRLYRNVPTYYVHKKAATWNIFHHEAVLELHSISNTALSCKFRKKMGMRAHDLDVVN
jgi:hypothetical protein